jgi:hypothetical protein
LRREHLEAGGECPRRAPLRGVGLGIEIESGTDMTAIARVPSAAAGPFLKKGARMLDFLFVLIVLFLAVVVPIWAVVDAANRPAIAFYGAGSNKTAWIVVIVIAWLIGLGFFLGGFYLLFTRPKVRRQEEHLGS